MVRRFLLFLISALCLSAACPAMASRHIFASCPAFESYNVFAAQTESSPAYQQGTLEGLTFSNPWADYRITFPSGTYFNPASLVDYMSSYTGMDYEFAASLYGDMNLYPCINITFQDALIPLKDCTQNLLDIYMEKDYSCQVKTGVWLGSHPFTYVRADSTESDIYVENYLRIEGEKLIWFCIKCQKDDTAAQDTVKQVISSVTAYNPSAS